MKFNIKFKYILFIILSFVFVMSDVGAATQVNINEKYGKIGNLMPDSYSYSDSLRYLSIYKYTSENGVEKRKLLYNFGGIYHINEEFNNYDLLCYDACAKPSNVYNVRKDNSEFGTKIAYLMSKNPKSVKPQYAVAVAQLIAAKNGKNHCSGMHTDGEKFDANELLVEFAKNCRNSQYLKNHKYYVAFEPTGRGLNNDELCRIYNEVDKIKANFHYGFNIKTPIVSYPKNTEDNGESTIYTIKIPIDNPAAFGAAYTHSIVDIQKKAAVLPADSNSIGSSIISATSWYSINNKNYKFISANLDTGGLEIKLSKKGDCEPAVLTVDDHGSSNTNGILNATSGSNQYLALSSSLFVTSARIKCSNNNNESTSKCLVTKQKYSVKSNGECPKTSARLHAKNPGLFKDVPIAPKCDKEEFSGIYAYNTHVTEFAALSMGYSSIQAYTFSEIGANCCDDYASNIDFKNSVLSINSNKNSWDQAYDDYCLNKEQYCNYDQNTKSVYSSAFTIPYNGNGNPLITAKYAFEDLGCCNDYKNGTRGFSAVKTDLNWQNAYKTYCGGTTTEVTTSTACINPAPNSQTKVDNKINNCCLDDTHSYVQEVQLNDLFDNTKTHEGVTYFEPLPTCEGSDLDVAKGQINNYCDYYCTERLDIEVPGSTSADSGRYFKFNEIDGHASPKVDGYRRCRVTIKYDQWYSEYKQKLNELVTLFNDWQQKKAMLKMYQDAKNSRVAKTRSYDITCERCTTPSRSSCDSRCNSYLGYGHDQCISACMSPSCETKTIPATEDYYEYNYPNVYYGKESISSSTANVNFGYSFTPSADHVSKGTENHDSVTHDPSCGSDYHKIGSSAANYSAFSFDGTDSAESQARQAYQTKLQEIQTLQTQLNTCDRYLDDNYLYNLNPDVKFKYTQFFKNELGDPDSVITDVEYGDASCSTRKLDTANNAKDKIEGPTYSPNPGYTGVTNIAYSRLKNNLLLNQNPGLDNYTADMKFRYDKIYNTTCYWDNQSTYYTLVPSGASDTVQLTDNYTVHDRVYKVLLTSYDGVYETYWELENLGHEGRLQQYFDNPTDTLKNKNNGENVNANTCSGLSESDADMLGLSSTFTCTFKVTHKAITTGRCNPDSGHDITLNGNSCDDKAEGYQLFYFKVADPSNLFPDGNGEYGKNWSTDMINKVQSTDTYNPANETYKFVLTQGDMKLIKEYNDSRESEGGYSDFDFSCTCTDACVNCKSKFLEDYYSGTFYSGSGTFTPAGKKLNEIREKYGW